MKCVENFIPSFFWEALHRKNKHDIILRYEIENLKDY